MFEKPTAPLSSAVARLNLAQRPRWVLAAIGAALLAVAGGGAWWLWNGVGSGDDYLTQAVTMGDVEDSVTALGTLQPLQFVDVGTQVSGQLQKLHVNYGETVKQGQLLAEIDPTIYQARVNADEAQLLNLNAQLAQRQAERVLADQQFERQKELLKENATSQDAYDSADSRRKVTVAQISALQAQIKQTQSTLNGDMANLGYTKIHAPMDGTVVNLIAKRGQTLNANQTAPLILRIADLATMTVYAQVSEADVPKLKIGMRAYFTTLGRSDKRRYGTLRQIIPTPDVVNNVVLYNCLFDVENPDGDLLTQMSAQVYFIVAEARDVPIVSVSALRPATRAAAAANAENAADRPAPDARGQRRGPPEDNGNSVQARTTPYTVNVLEDGEPVQRLIEVGAMNRLVAEVKSGLKPGDLVILDAPGGAARPQQGQQGQGGFPGGFPGGNFQGGPRR